jgi:hypothetical protein
MNKISKYKNNPAQVPTIYEVGIILRYGSLLSLEKIVALVAINFLISAKALVIFILISAATSVLRLH